MLYFYPNLTWDWDKIEILLCRLNVFIIPSPKIIIPQPLFFAQPLPLILSLWPGLLFHWGISSSWKITFTHWKLHIWVFCVPGVRPVFFFLLLWLKSSLSWGKSLHLMYKFPSPLIIEMHKHIPPAIALPLFPSLIPPPLLGDSQWHITEL